MNKKDRARKLGCEIAGALGFLAALIGLVMAAFYQFGFDVTGGTLLDTSVVNLDRLNMRETGVQFGGNLMICGLLVYLANKRGLERYPEGG
ncbi:MAG: hypothetical protein ACK47B_18850 [Armatimonadota bacterium]